MWDLLHAKHLLCQIVIMRINARLQISEQRAWLIRHRFHTPRFNKAAGEVSTKLCLQGAITLPQAQQSWLGCPRLKVV